MILDILGFITILAIAFLIMGALSPIEALGWWAGWFKQETPNLAPSIQPSSFKQCLVFLTGIHSVSDETYARREIQFLDMLKERLPDTLILEVFPYAATNQALTGQRFFAWFWRMALRLKQGRIPLAGVIINLRNSWQVAVSADKRYGPIYNQATAEAITRDLVKQGYVVGSGVPLILMGYSGGGQIAIGAARYLKPIINAPVRVVSLGGIFCADPGLLELEGFYHLSGYKDRLQTIAVLFFPGRWPLLRYSPWNQAKSRGMVQIISVGPVDHTGKNGYLDNQAKLPDGRSFLEQTVEVVVSIVRRKEEEEGEGDFSSLPSFCTLPTLHAALHKSRPAWTDCERLLKHKGKDFPGHSPRLAVSLKRHQFEIGSLSCERF